jgi:hypothetical protein
MKEQILVIVAGLSLLVAPAVVLGAPAGPPGGLEVKVTNTPLPVVGEITAAIPGGVEVTNSPDVRILNDESNPVPVTVQNTETGTSTTIQQNLYTAGPGGRTIGGPAEHDFGVGSDQIVIFRVFSGLAVMACYTIENLGPSTLEVLDGATGSISPGKTETMCRDFNPDQWVQVKTFEEGVGRFRWRVDLIAPLD